MEPRKTKKRRSPVRPSPSKPPLIVTRHPLPVAPPILSLTPSCPARAWPVATSASRLALRLAPPHPPPSPSVRLAAAASRSSSPPPSVPPPLHLGFSMPTGPSGIGDPWGTGPGVNLSLLSLSGPRRGTAFGDQGGDGDRSPGPDPPRCHPNQ